MFCTPSDFNLIPYAIPNLTLVANSFPLYIEKVEKEILSKLLGVTLYNEFLAGLAALPDVWESSITYAIDAQVVQGVSIWKALEENIDVLPVEGIFWTKVEDNIYLKIKEGFPFNVGSYEYNYEGLVDLLVPYIFYRWTRDTFDNNSGIGIVQGNAENAEVIEPKRRLVDAWNDFAEKAEYLAAFVQVSNTPDVVYANYEYYYIGTLNTFGL